MKRIILTTIFLISALCSKGAITYAFTDSCNFIYVVRTDGGITAPYKINKQLITVHYVEPNFYFAFNTQYQLARIQFIINFNNITSPVVASAQAAYDQIYGMIISPCSSGPEDWATTLAQGNTSGGAKPTIDPGDQFIVNGTVRLVDLGGDNYVDLLINEDNFSDPIFNWKLNDADRTLDMQADLTVSGAANVSGTNTGDQTITLSGDVTGSGTGAITTTIADNSVDGTDIALGSDAQGDVMYYNGTDWARLAAGTSGHFLKTQGAGANPVWDAPTATVADGDKGDITVSGSGTVWTIDNDVVTFAKMQNISTAKVLGRATAGSGDIEELSTTGTGNVVLATSPTLTTPNIGVATATTVNGLTLTDPAAGDFSITGSTMGAPFNVQEGVTGLIISGNSPTKSLTFKNSIILQGTDGTAIDVTTPTSGKIMQANGTNVALSSITWPTSASTSGKIPKSNGTNIVMSTETYAIPGTSGNVMTSDGTNWVSQAPAASSSLGFAGAALVVIKSTTVYAGVGTGNASTTIADNEYYVPSAGTLQKLRVYVSANGTGGPTNTVTVYVNGSPTSITISFTTSTGILTDLVNTQAVSAGDRVTFQIVNAETAGGTHNITVESISIGL